LNQFKKSHYQPISKDYSRSSKRKIGSTIPSRDSAEVNPASNNSKIKLSNNSQIEVNPVVPTIVVESLLFLEVDIDHCGTFQICKELF